MAQQISQQTIKFTIRQDGTVTEEVMGVVGTDCENLTKTIEERLGVVEKVEKHYESVSKIWKAKKDLGLLKSSFVDWKMVEDSIGLSSNYKTSQFIANKSITLVKDDKNLIPMDPSSL